MWIQQSEYIEVDAIVAKVRENAGLTQQQLARRLKKPQSFVVQTFLESTPNDILLGFGRTNLIQRPSSLWYSPSPQAGGHIGTSGCRDPLVRA